jgi:hypothetical protein
MQTKTFAFKAVHAFRVSGTELIYTVIGIRNLDLFNSMEIRRLMLRNHEGIVLSDTGPATANAHPVNTDFSPSLNITVVPPGGAGYLNTAMLFGIAALSTAQDGFAMTGLIQIATPGDPKLISPHGDLLVREVVAGPAFGIERSRAATHLWEV